MYKLFKTPKLRKFESKSQRIKIGCNIALCCLRLLSYENLKANHNVYTRIQEAKIVV
ncbi:MAG: hypothetical protein JWQ38_336 [Flavipsychrobacter sp.]|nr:hypothetical protein [Flavipsychrobacter sp.]